MIFSFDYLTKIHSAHRWVKVFWALGLTVTKMKKFIYVIPAVASIMLTHSIENNIVNLGLSLTLALLLFWIVDIFYNKLD